MKDIQSQIIAKLNSSKKIALCIDAIDSVDMAFSTVVLVKHIEGIEGADLSVILKDTPDVEISDILSKYGVTYLTEPKPLTYVISIDYGSAHLEKVKYDTDEDQGILKFFIQPTNGKFDFENVEYSTEGRSYDLTLTMGIESFKDMGEIYEKNGYLFKDNTVISIIENVDSLGDLYWKTTADRPFLWSVYTLLKGALSGEVLNIVLEGLLGMDHILESSSSKYIWSAISQIQEDGADVDLALKNVYFAKSFSNLDVQIKLMHGIKVAKDVGVIWSTVSNEDLKFTGVNENTLDIKGRIPFNVSGEFDLAIAGYEVVKDRILVTVESNNVSKYSAKKIAELFNGTGSESHAQFFIDNMPIKDFSKRFFAVLSDMYDTKVEGSSVNFKA